MLFSRKRIQPPTTELLTPEMAVGAGVSKQVREDIMRLEQAQRKMSSRYAKTLNAPVPIPKVRSREEIKAALMARMRPVVKRSRPPVVTLTLNINKNRGNRDVVEESVTGPKEKRVKTRAAASGKE